MTEASGVGQALEEITAVRLTAERQAETARQQAETAAQLVALVNQLVQR